MQIQGHEQAKEQRIHAKMRQQRNEDRHEDDDDLGPLQRPAQQKDDDLRQHHELYRRHVERQHPLVDDLLATEQGKSRRENAGTNKQPAHHGAGLGRQIDRLADHADIEASVGSRQHQTTGRAHGCCLGGRGQTEHDGAQYRHDQHRQRKKGPQQHLEDFHPGKVEIAIGNGQSHDTTAQRNPESQRYRSAFLRRQGFDLRRSGWLDHSFGCNGRRGGLDRLGCICCSSFGCRLLQSAFRLRLL